MESKRRSFLKTCTLYEELTPLQLDEQGLQPDNITMLREQIQKARVTDDDKIALRSFHPVFRQLDPIHGNFSSYEQYFAKIYESYIKSKQPIPPTSTVPSTAQSISHPPDSRAWDGYIPHEDVANIMNFSYSHRDLTQKLREATLKEGTNKEQDLSFITGPPNLKNPYVMTDAEQKTHDQLISYNTSRGVNLDELQKARESIDRYKGPTETYRRIFNDQISRDNAHNQPHTSTPAKPNQKVTIVSGSGGHGGDGDDDDDDDSVNSNQSIHLTNPGGDNKYNVPSFFKSPIKSVNPINDQNNQPADLPLPYTGSAVVGKKDFQPRESATDEFHPRASSDGFRRDPPNQNQPANENNRDYDQNNRYSHPWGRKQKWKW